MALQVNNGDAFFGQTGKNFAFGFGHAREGTETFKMRRGKIVDQRRFRRSQCRGVSDLALMISTQFDYGVLMLWGQAQQRQRHADIIVQVACGIERFAALAQNRRGHLFYRGFAG